VRRLGKRASLLILAYVAVILAVVVAGFLAKVLGIWASILWGILLILGLVLYLPPRPRSAWMIDCPGSGKGWGRVGLAPGGKG
jgi:hypothetical protein